MYEPCDDSFALVDALLADKVNLIEQHPKICLEVGCGSGYVITSLALILGEEGGAQFFATDISPVIHHLIPLVSMIETELIDLPESSEKYAPSLNTSLDLFLCICSCRLQSSIDLWLLKLGTSDMVRAYY